MAVEGDVHPTDLKLRGFYRADPAGIRHQLDERFPVIAIVLCGFFRDPGADAGATRGVIHLEHAFTDIDAAGHLPFLDLAIELHAHLAHISEDGDGFLFGIVFTTRNLAFGEEGLDRAADFSLGVHLEHHGGLVLTFGNVLGEKHDRPVAGDDILDTCFRRLLAFDFYFFFFITGFFSFRLTF